jgi:hypothetical protein
MPTHSSVDVSIVDAGDVVVSVSLKLISPKFESIVFLDVLSD